MSHSSATRVAATVHFHLQEVLSVVVGKVLLGFQRFGHVPSPSSAELPTYFEISNLDIFVVSLLAVLVFAVDQTANLENIQWEFTFMEEIELSSSDSEDLNECPKEDIKGKGKSKGKLGDGSGGSMTGESQRRDVMRAVVVTGFVVEILALELRWVQKARDKLGMKSRWKFSCQAKIARSKFALLSAYNGDEVDYTHVNEQMKGTEDKIKEGTLQIDQGTE
ncbi:hypothetical protein Tco_0155354 [Tanacetum coccineum]